VMHAVATLAWRVTKPEKKRPLFLTFSNACGRCGRCIDACSLYEAKTAAEAPVFKLKRFYKMIATRTLTAAEIRLIAEQTAQCTLCGLCGSVCPFSFNFVDLYKELLASASKIIHAPSAE
jgi:ferredoxin